MIWAFLRRFPQLLILGGIFFGSTAIFLLWLLSGTVWWPFKARKTDFRPQIALFESKPERFILVDNNLHDLDTGALVFRSWLRDGMPDALFYDAEHKKLVAKFVQGFVRYNLAGQEEVRVAPPFRGVFSNNLKWVLFAREQNIWRADVDWKEFKMVNERQLTSVGYINETNFAGNVLFATDVTMLVLQFNKLLRINLDTGAVKEAKLPLDNISKRLSPDRKHIVGARGKQFYCYDVDADTLNPLDLGPGVILDYQWLTPDTCAVVHSDKEVGIYDREAHKLKVLVHLPAVCGKMDGPSPDGRFVFCWNREAGFLVDLENKAVTPLVPGAGLKWVTESSFIFSRDLPDSELRGTWMHNTEEGAKRVSPEPFLVAKAGPFALLHEESGLIVMGTKNGISTMKQDGSEPRELVKLARQIFSVLTIGKWNPPD
jgi:hypothetical protein